MSHHYGETNPHFWPHNEPDFPVPYQHLNPESHFDPNPHQPQTIQLRPRQKPSHSPPPRRQPQPPHVVEVYPPRAPPNRHNQQPPLETYPPRGPPDRHNQQPPLEAYPPSGPPDRHNQQPPLKTYPPSGPPDRPNQQPPLEAYPPSGPLDHQPPPRRHREPRAQSQTKPPPRKQRRPNHVTFEQGVPQPPPHENLMYPTSSKTKPLTWFGAVFCIILWLVIILGGLLVLVIYLIYRPKIPRFEISSTTLNAAYLDMGYLLNADLTVLANFTNPNKKVNVDFSYVTLRLYFDKLLIASQYVGPFSAVNTGSRLANVEFVSSQVRLPPRVIQQLITQIQRNRVMFEVDVVFHARSSFGSLLRYSYWLYGRCIIEMTGPPTGVMIATKCRTRE